MAKIKRDVMVETEKIMSQVPIDKEKLLFKDFGAPSKIAKKKSDDTFSVGDGPLQFDGQPLNMEIKETEHPHMAVIRMLEERVDQLNARIEKFFTEYAQKTGRQY